MLQPCITAGNQNLSETYESTSRELVSSESRYEPCIVLGGARGGGAYQTLGWIKEAQIDWNFTHIGDLQSAWASACVIHSWPKVEGPGRRDAVLAEHSPGTDLYISRLIVEVCSTSTCWLATASSVIAGQCSTYAQLFCCPHSSTYTD